MSEPYSDLQQIEMSIKSAQHLVGQATKSMNGNQLKAAQDALDQAKQQFQQAVAHKTGVNENFFEFSSELIEKCDTQLREAQE
ncbi:DUF2564 family protein [Guptibacillus algicola]|uniref:DUF2564 family protein n=1 Tax=Guptibacillus algicola TaxID=225844 RepID=UPI001CD338F3|nr:DUF2564 family protein [Alkalihalobacillus algicola]MCA0988197.1 DUF2564 family protein [Alkalihalobacillus algicola]